MADIPSFTGPGGMSPSDHIAKVIQASQVTAGDMVYALNGQRRRILERTQHGISVDGSQFVDYSSKRPYYYYPGAQGASTGSRRASAGRFHSRTGGVGQRTRTGIKYEGGYREFKREGLGRANVDLTGPRAPHMLDAIQIHVGGINYTGREAPTNKIDEAELGFYGEEVTRARAHNEGTKTVPKRYFFGANQQDLDQIQKDASEHRMERLKGL